MDGFEVGLLARSRDLLEDLRQSIDEQGGTCFAATCDLRDPDNTAAAIAATVDALGGVDALVNNAGLVIRKNVFEISMDEWRAMIDTNINGLLSTRAVLPYFKAQQRGHIVNVSSISGKVPLPGGNKRRDEIRCDGFLAIAVPRGARLRHQGDDRLSRFSRFGVAPPRHAKRIIHGK